MTSKARLAARARSASHTLDVYQQNNNQLSLEAPAGCPLQHGKMVGREQPKTERGVGGGEVESAPEG